ncbi:MAG: hypothetical protein JWP59_494 [Massilia sp.]|nr:hypothetical protein [Massilia sp.]
MSGPKTRTMARMIALAAAALAVIGQASMALLLCAVAQAAPPLSVPAYPPGPVACGGGWHSAQRVAGLGSGSGQDSGYVLEAAYDQGRGVGRLVRRALSGSVDALVVGAPAWDAAAVLDGAGPPPAERRIFSMSADGRTVPLVWAQLADDQRLALDPGGDGLGEARLGYLRGERAGEGTLFRQRQGLLGEIVRSTPLLAGAPAAAAELAAVPGYAAFYRQYLMRQRRVVVGASDGMLHAFDWSDGAERFAYLPRALLPSLARHADAATPADAPRFAGVDAAPGQGEALISGQWRSILAGGMGMGARGLFALDITDAAADPVALWEFTEQDDAAIGFIHAPPLIVKLRVGGRAAERVYRYFALVGNGINPADGGADGLLFLLALDKPAAAPWRLGDNYLRLRTPSSAPQVANALAPPVLTFNPDGSARRAYAGDLQGTLWRFDLDGAVSARDVGGAPGAAAPGAAALFHARAADGAVQPITQAARPVFAPGGGYLIMFGTGRAIEAGDLQPAGFVQQSFYAVRDSDASPIAPVAGRRALAQRRLSAADGADAFFVDGERFDYNGAGSTVKQGWYFDYPRALADGERLAAAPAPAGGAVAITTTAPGRDPCHPTARSYLLDSLTGLAYNRRGIPSPGTLTGADIGKVKGMPTGSGASDDGLPPLLVSHAAGAGAATPTGATRVLRSVGVFRLPSAGAAAPVESARVGGPAGRLSWREIANWRELHAAAVKPP